MCNKQKTLYLFIIFTTILFLSCDKKTPTESEDRAQLSGYVFQAENGFLNYISNADISIGIYNTTSDSIGRYSLEVPLGEYVIQTSHEQFDISLDTVKIRGNRNYFISMKNGPTYSVSGVVTDTIGNVVEGAIVELEHLRDTTDIDGRYEFNDILSGRRILSCDYSDYYIFTDTFEIRNSDITRDINLIRQGYKVSGTVLHPVDGLLNGIEVILDDSLYDTTDANGEYLFENIYIGEYQLQIKSEIYDNQVIDFSLGKADLIQTILLTKPLLLKVFGTVSHSVDGLLSGIEVILDDSLYDTTDINGEYQFDDVYAGEHSLQIQPSVYNYEIFIFNLIDSDLYKDLIVSKSTIQKLFIEKDALVKVSYSTEEGYSNRDENFGAETVNFLYHTIMEYLQWDSLGQYRVTSYNTSRIFMKIDEFNSSLVDSVLLVLPFYQFSTLRFGEIRLANVSEYWDELAITWNNQPSVTTEQTIFNSWTGISTKLVIKITEKLSLLTNSNGFRISFTDESCYFCDLGLLFYSSEHADTSKRPYILVYRTEK